MAVQTQLLQRLLQQEGHQVVLVPVNLSFPGWLAFVESIPGIRTGIRFLLFSLRLFRIGNRIDLYHILANSYISFFLVTMPAVLIARLRRVPTVVNYRGGLARQFLQRYHRIVRPILQWADVITVPNGFLKSVFNDFAIPTEEVPNVLPFESEQFSSRPEKNGSINIFISRQLEELYNIPCALRAFKKIKQQWPEAELRVAGEGSLRASLESFVQEQGLKGVAFLGGLDTGEMIRELAAATVMLNPSNADNMPISILEAFAAGVPVVSTNVGGVPYLIRDAETGLLVQAGDARAMADAVDRLLRDPELHERIKQQARVAVQQYTWLNVKERLFKVYREVLRQRRSFRTL